MKNKRIHRIANVGDKIILAEHNFWNENAKSVLGDNIATVTELLGFTRAMTDLGVVYHSWYDVVKSE